MAETYRLRYLRGKKLNVFLAVAQSIVPADGTDQGAGTLQSAGIADWAIARLAPQLRKKLLVLLFLVNILGLFFGGRFFVNLSPEKRNRLLSWMESGPLGPFRMGFFGLKNYACMGYYSQEKTWKSIGYEGPLTPQVPYSDPAIRGLCNGSWEVTE
ncbi:MAG: hypothetical protein AB1921_20160 [Thermodesulfobacteriota bacterium]